MPEFEVSCRSAAAPGVKGAWSQVYESREPFQLREVEIWPITTDDTPFWLDVGVGPAATERIIIHDMPIVQGLFHSKPSVWIPTDVKTHRVAVRAQSNGEAELRLRIRLGGSGLR